jgi:hypothetical protein
LDCSIWRLIASSAACAWAIETPCLSLPMAPKFSSCRLLRGSCRVALGSHLIAEVIITGIHKLTFIGGLSPSKPAGPIPTTVNRWLFKTIV